MKRNKVHAQVGPPCTCNMCHVQYMQSNVPCTCSTVFFTPCLLEVLISLVPRLLPSFLLHPVLGQGQVLISQAQYVLHVQCMVSAHELAHAHPQHD